MIKRNLFIERPQLAVVQQQRHQPSEKSGRGQQKVTAFDAFMSLNKEAEAELAGWIENAPNSYDVVSHGEPEIVLSTDASSTGWRCTLGQKGTGGYWIKEEAQHHINELELYAVFRALQVLIFRILNGEACKSYD